MTHTKGPWKATRSNPAEGADCWWITGDFGPHNQEVEIGTVGKEDNARLIAAAPDLLEALKELHKCSPCQNGCAPDDMTCASNKAATAIAAAEKE